MVSSSEDKDDEMQNYHGVVQNIVMIGDGEYRVTFRAYEERDVEATFCENEDVPFALYSMVARREGNGFVVVPEGLLAECIDALDEHEPADLEELNKSMIGVLAKDIALSLADSGMFTPCGDDED